LASRSTEYRNWSLDAEHIFWNRIILLEEFSTRLDAIHVSEKVHHSEPIAHFEREIGYDKLVVRFVASSTQQPPNL